MIWAKAKLGGKGVFTKELEEQLLEVRDTAVQSPEIFQRVYVDIELAEKAANREKIKKAIWDISSAGIEIFAALPWVSRRENAADNGARFFFEQCVSGIERSQEAYRITTRQGQRFCAPCVVKQNTPGMPPQGTAKMPEKVYWS